MIGCQELNYSTGGKRILDRVSASAPSGAITALVGPNGAGKSTLLAMLGRMLVPDSGMIRLGGENAAALARAAFARRVTTLRQATRITPRLTVRDLVGFGRYPHNPGQLTAADRKIVDACLQDLALSDLAERHLDTLSGGQQQRALIAMALAQETEVLLLDEPLNNLDLTHARRVMQLLAQRSRSGRTVVTVLHDLTIAARFADHVIAVKDGQVLNEGPPATVFTPEVLSQLYDAQVEVHLIDGKPVVLPI